jgi:hypothetical protein
MIHDKGETDGKPESKICEYKITQIKERKYLFKGREHKNVDTIIYNLSALSNAFTAKSGRKVYCKDAAVRPAAAKKKKKKVVKAQEESGAAGKAEGEGAPEEEEEQSEEEEEESDHEIETDAVNNDTGLGFDDTGIPDPYADEYVSSDDGGGTGGDAAVGGFSDDE